MARTLIVNLPDGTTVTRTSKTRLYTWAVMQTVNNVRKAEALRGRVARLRIAADSVAAMRDSGDLSALTRKACLYSIGYYSLLAGDAAVEDPGYTLPDHEDAEAWNACIDGSLRSITDSVSRLTAQAAELAEGAGVSYRIMMWNSRYDLAIRACSNPDFGHGLSYVTLHPVPVIEVKNL